MLKLINQLLDNFEQFLLDFLTGRKPEQKIPDPLRVLPRGNDQ